MKEVLVYEIQNQVKKREKRSIVSLAVTAIGSISYLSKRRRVVD
jgi:hypothetical protein